MLPSGVQLWAPSCKVFMGWWRPLGPVGSRCSRTPDASRRNRIQLAAICIEVCWSVVVSGAAAHSAAAGAFEREFVHWRCGPPCVARVRDRYL